MKKVILFSPAYLMMSGCAYCKNRESNGGEQIKVDMQNTFAPAESRK